MKKQDHLRIAEFITQKVNLAETERSALIEGSSEPDEKGEIHHALIEGKIKRGIILAIKYFGERNGIKGAKILGKVLHYIADLHIPRFDSKHHRLAEKTVSKQCLPVGICSCKKMNLEELLDFVSERLYKGDANLNNACETCLEIANSVIGLSKSLDQPLLRRIKKELERPEEILIPIGVKHKCQQGEEYIEIKYLCVHGEHKGKVKIYHVKTSDLVGREFMARVVHRHKKYKDGKERVKPEIVEYRSLNENDESDMPCTGDMYYEEELEDWGVSLQPIKHQCPNALT